MISHNPFSNCMSARPYYYDFLSEQTRGSIPEDTLKHIIQCMDCQGEIGRLKTLFERLDQKESSGPSRRDLAIGALLKLHFTHIDEQVKCSTAKLFLASLADPVLQIRTLTPITKHIDRCRACRDDLLRLQEMHLTHQQLCHLGQFLVDKLAEEGADGVSRLPARSAIDSVESVVLHETIYDIVRRPDSDVVTRFTLHEHIDEGIGPESDNKYTDWRISARAQGREDFTDPDNVETLPTTVSPARKRALSVGKLKRYFKPAIATAAAITIACALFLSTPVLQGTAFTQFADSLENVRNVCTTTFHVDRSEPTQIIWISQALNVKLFDNRFECALYDVESGIRKKKQQPSGPIETEKLSPEILAEIKDQMSHSSSLLPLSRIRNLPEGAQWSQVDNESIETTVEGTEVYDLTWTRKRQSKILSYNKRRFFVDANTDLPKRIELYSRRGSESEYELDSFITVTYPTDAEIEEAIRSRFGQ